MSEIREVAIEFMRLTPTTREEIARKLGLDDGLTGMRTDVASLEICRRVHDKGCFDEFAKLVKEARSKLNLGAAVPSEPTTPTEEIGLLREELRNQWEYNHAEMCSIRWPHPLGEMCHWPLPKILDEPARVEVGPSPPLADDDEIWRYAEEACRAWWDSFGGSADPEGEWEGLDATEQVYWVHVANSVRALGIGSRTDVGVHPDRWLPGPGWSTKVVDDPTYTPPRFADTPEEARPAFTNAGIEAAARSMSNSDVGHDADLSIDAWLFLARRAISAADRASSAVGPSPEQIDAGEKAILASEDVDDHRGFFYADLSAREIAEIVLVAACSVRGAE